MEYVIIAFVLVLFVAVIVFIIVHNRKKNEEIKYYAAAGNIIREDYLNYSLQNHMNENSQIQEPRGRKTMLYIKAKGNKDARYVFDPEKTVYIGRDKDYSNIYINNNLVSQNHCCLYSNNDCVFLKDCNSVNGTVLMRGLFGRYNISGGSKIQINSGDRFRVGPCTFIITLFYYDMSLM